MVRWMKTAMFCCYLLTAVTMLSNAQTYHFSQGWLPGGKRSSRSDAVVDDVDAGGGGSVFPVARLTTGKYRRRTSLRPAMDNRRPDQRQVHSAISNAGQQLTALHRLVG